MSETIDPGSPREAIQKRGAVMNPLKRAWGQIDREGRVIIIATPFAIPIAWWLTFAVIPAVDVWVKGYDVQTPCPAFCDRCRGGERR